MIDHLFCDKVTAYMKRHPRISRQDAVDAVSRADPELVADFIVQSQRDPQAARLAAEKFGLPIDAD